MTEAIAPSGKCQDARIFCLVDMFYIGFCPFIFLLGVSLGSFVPVKNFKNPGVRG